MKNLRLLTLAALTMLGTSPVFAQHGHPGGGPPAGVGGPSGAGSAAGDHGPSMGAANGNANSTAHPNSMQASPADVLSHNSAIGDKIKTLTGQDASTACGGFKNIGQCIAAAHVAQNLNIQGGFAALKSTMTSGSGMNLGKAIQTLAPSANAKSESKKANKQAQQDLNSTNS